jgi:hypothetical protein
MVRVAALSELPPGKGKVVEVEGRRVTIFNANGHLRATAAPHPAGRGASLLAGPPECGHGGLSFDVFAEDSPADLGVEAPCEVRVRWRSVWVVL